MKIKLKALFFTLMMVIILGSVAYAASPTVPALGMIKMGQNIYIQPGEIENSDAVSLGGDIYVNGTVNGNAVCIGGNVYINGSVKGDVTCIGGNINVGSAGKVSGKTTEIGRSFNIPFKYRNNYFKNITGYYPGRGSFTAFILLFVFSIIIYKIMPKNINRIAFEARNNLGKNLIYGYSALIIIPVITVLLIVTIIGIILIPILLLVSYIIFLIGFTSLSLYCGKRIGLAILNRNISDIWCLFIGLLLYELIKNISFAGIGTIVTHFFVIPLAMGLSLSSKFGTFRSWKRPDEDGCGPDDFRG